MDSKQNKESKTVYILLGVVIAVLLCGLVFGLQIIAHPPVISLPAKSPTKTNEQVIRECVAMADEYLPGQNSYEWDSEKHVFTMFFWDQSFKNGGISAKNGNKKAMEAWESLRSVIVSLSAHMQQKFKDAGLGTSVAVCAVDQNNHDTVYIMANNGKLLYDATKD